MHLFLPRMRLAAVVPAAQRAWAPAVVLGVVLVTVSKLLPRPDDLELEGGRAARGRGREPRVR